jgi:uncharacterized membrane protein
MLYNAMFERVEKKFGFKPTVPVRIGHAVGFEGGLVLVVVLLAAWCCPFPTGMRSCWRWG